MLFLGDIDQLLLMGVVGSFFFWVLASYIGSQGYNVMLSKTVDL